MRRILAAAWLILAAAVWNGFFDLYVSQGSREYLQRRAEFDAGLGPEPAMDLVLAAARWDGLVAATLWAGSVLTLGWATLRLGARGHGGAVAQDSSGRNL